MILPGEAPSWRTSVLLAVLLAGCATSAPTRPPPDAPPAVSAAAPAAQPPTPAPTPAPAGFGPVDVWGTLWSPEAFWRQQRACGPRCQAPPFLVDNSPLFQAAIVKEASVALYDPRTRERAGDGAGTSSATGTWHLFGVPGRPPPKISLQEPGIVEDNSGAKDPFFALSSGGRLAAKGAGFVPTLTVRPILTSHPVCAGLVAASVQREGALQAAAAALTREGTATTVDQLLDPARYRAVVLVAILESNAALHPGFRPSAVSGARGSALRASVGRVLYLDLDARGGFTVAKGESAPLGAAVVLVPAGAGEPLVLTAEDPVKDPSMGRPWAKTAVTIPELPAGTAGFAPIVLSPPPGQRLEKISDVVSWLCPADA